MIFRTLFLLFFNSRLVLMLRHEKPVAEKVWSERCVRNMMALNDCNWCHCNAKSAYTCKARACNEVDMFGHFNDAIRDIDVGMEGRGVWRSQSNACEPGVHYRKNDLLCVCTEDGKWPNPVCRDIFQVLHSVETTEHIKPSDNHTCAATKLYLYGCNVCFCPSTGLIDPKLCTDRQCDNDNVERSHSKEKEKDNEKGKEYEKGKEEILEEVYAACTPTKRYRLGCQTCVCLRNNRLLCDNCTVAQNVNLLILDNTECHGKTPGVIFKKNCNFCQCDMKDTIYCSAKKCLAKHTPISLPTIQFDTVEQVQDDSNCVPGSKYVKDCNTCHCFMMDGVKYFGCSLTPCNRPADVISEMKDCVEGTSYVANCMICHCVMENDIKREYCTMDDSCKLENNGSIRLLSSMHGYCEPLHFYQYDCNKCRCLADGKTLACTSKLCFKRGRVEKPMDKNEQIVMKSRTEQKPAAKFIKMTTTEKPMIVEFIPFVQKDHVCPKGQTYSVECNVCYCMEKGNAVCTTKIC